MKKLQKMLNSSNVHCKIIITNDLQLQCQIQTQFKSVITIELQPKQKVINPTLTFDMNDILFGEEKENTIHFMKEWIEHPDELKYYSITYLNKEYSVVAELLFALIIN